jgi:hypothetical protein
MESMSNEMKSSKVNRDSGFIIYLKTQLIKSRRREKMLDKIADLFDMIPDTLKMIIIISIIALFWDFVL